jgi:hypothetical protein
MDKRLKYACLKKVKKNMIALPPAHRAYGPEGPGLEFGISKIA